MNKQEPISIYIDTCSFQKLKFNQDIALLLAASKKGLIRLYVSEVLIWERAKHQYESEISHDRVIPYNDGFWRYQTWYKEVFKEHQVIILKTKNEHTREIPSILENPEYYFCEKDKRDALFFIVAISELAKNTIIITGDIDLCNVFIKQGYLDVRKDANLLLEEIRDKMPSSVTFDKPDINKIDESQVTDVFSDPFLEFIKSADYSYIPHLKTLPTKKDQLDKFLKDTHYSDDQIRKRILGYVAWFTPMLKDDLERMLVQNGHEKNMAINQAQILKQNNMLIETQNYWFPNEKHDLKEIFDQAMAAVMNEVLEMMELI
ncbi:TPA: hypothetical protein JBB95_03440 [Legionella pneumophila subsp. pneumophila]|nr:hypothetical protein [Legionella pneumophila subsp. pneumophila]